MCTDKNHNENQNTNFLHQFDFQVRNNCHGRWRVGLPQKPFTHHHACPYRVDDTLTSFYAHPPGIFRVNGQPGNKM